MQSSISQIVDSNRPDLLHYEALYRHFHANPELSFQEHDTAARIQYELSRMSDAWEIFPNIGKTGVAVLFKNGPGSVVLLRADIDGLPVVEKTGLEYASTKKMLNLEGIEKPVMHACGHDMHMTSLLAAADILLRSKKEWSGTLMLIFQPAEERGAGAEAMVKDGLYSKVPIPDIVLGGHLIPNRSGVLHTKRGMMACSADSIAVTLHGRGGHGSQPHRTVDPIVMAAHTIVRLQTITSRETDPSDLSVVSVCAINAGDAENIISDVAHLKLDIRTLNPTTRDRVLSGVKRIVEAESLASNAPKPPEFKQTRTFPFLLNDDDVTAQLETTFAQHFPTSEKGYNPTAPRLAFSEDFGILATAVNRPACFWAFGGVDPDIWDKAQAQGRVLEDIPVNHSPYFAPVIQPTLKTGADAYAVAALTFLMK